MNIFIIDEDRCLNYNYKKTECHNCRNVCPQKCWDDAGKPLTDRCIGCGLCQSVCPVDAIGVDGIPNAAWNELTARQEGELHLSCRRYGQGPWSCLGFLNSRDLVALAWPEPTRAIRDVHIYISHCADCRTTVAESLKTAIEEANRFLDRFGRQGILPETSPPPEATTAAMDRRSFFTSLFATSLETARNVMWPEDGAVPLSKALWRSQVLKDRNSGGLEMDQDVFPNLAVSAECIACGLCEKICKVHAVTASESETGIKLWHEPMLCTGCGLCVAHCPVEAITMVKPGKAAKQRMAEQTFPRCNECGSHFKPAGRQLTCFECLVKGRQSVFGP